MVTVSIAPVTVGKYRVPSPVTTPFPTSTTEATSCDKHVQVEAAVTGHPTDTDSLRESSTSTYNTSDDDDHHVVMVHRHDDASASVMLASESAMTKWSGHLATQPKAKANTTTAPEATASDKKRLLDSMSPPANCSSSKRKADLAGTATATSQEKKKARGSRDKCKSYRCRNKAQPGSDVCCKHDCNVKAVKTLQRVCGRQGCQNISMRGGLCRKHGGAKIESLLRGYDSIKNDDDWRPKSDENAPTSKMSDSDKNGDGTLRVLCSVATTFRGGGINEHEKCGQVKYANQNAPIFKAGQSFANPSNLEVGEVLIKPEARTCAAAIATNLPNHGVREDDSDSDDGLGALIYKSSHTAKVRCISELFVAPTTIRESPMSPGSISMGSSHNDEVEHQNNAYWAASVDEKSRTWLSTQTGQDDCQALRLVPNQVSLGSTLLNNHHNENSFQSNGAGVKILTNAPPLVITDPMNSVVKQASEKSKVQSSIPAVQNAGCHSASNQLNGPSSSGSLIMESSIETSLAELQMPVDRSFQGSDLTKRISIPLSTTAKPKTSQCIVDNGAVKTNKATEQSTASGSKKNPQNRGSPTKKEAKANDKKQPNKRKAVKKDKMIRPYNLYNVFFIFERERIIKRILAESTKTSGDDEKEKKAAQQTKPKPGDGNGTKSDEDELHIPPLPSRYAHLVAPYRWWMPREHQTRRRHRKTHGVASFYGLAKDIAATWKTIDDETKQWCSEVQQILKKRQQDLVKKALAGKNKKNLRSVKSSKKSGKKSVEKSKSSTNVAVVSRSVISHSALTKAAHHNAAGVQENPPSINIAMQINKTQVAAPNMNEVGAMLRDLKGLIKKTTLPRANQAKSSCMNIAGHADQKQVIAPNSTQKSSPPNSANIAHREIELVAELESKACSISDTLLRLNTRLNQEDFPPVKSSGPVLQRRSLTNDIHSIMTPPRIETQFDD